MADHDPRLLILACSRAKRHDATPMPALERYDGPFYRVLRRWQRTAPHATLDLYVLSARFGLIPSSQPICDYDQLMNARRAQELHGQVTGALQQILAAKHYASLCLCMGQQYRRALGDYEAFVPPGTTVTVCNGPIGKMQAMLRDWLYGHPLETPRGQKSSKRRGAVRIRGVEIALTPAEIHGIARRALSAEEAREPMQRESGQYQVWYAEIDGQRVSAKWLASQLTGLPVGAFVTDEARRVLAQLGIEVKRI